MKKITLSLLAALTTISLGFGQANISVEAPKRNANYLDVLPNGSFGHTAFHAVYLVNSSELGALTGSLITSMGLQLSHGTVGQGVIGNFTLSLENTTDMTYSKSTSYTTAIQTMTTCFTNTILIPVSTNSAVINLPFPQSFTYTGDGLYVAVDWVTTTPLAASSPSTSWAAFYTKTVTAGTNLMAMEQETMAPAPDLMNQFNVCPSFQFRAVNTSTNELSITKFDVPGKVAKLFGLGSQIVAEVKNSSTINKSNIAVTLSVSGANSHVETQTITSLNAGLSATVGFSSFNPTVNGLNNMSVSIISDDNDDNNQFVRTQSVTCNIYADNQNTTIGGGVGFPNGTGMFLNKINPAINASITAVRLAISSSASNSGKAVCGALLDATGNIIAMTNTVTLSASMLGAFRAFTFTPAEALSSGTDYYVGLVQTQTGHYPIGNLDNVYGYQPTGYYTAPLAGGSTPNQVTTSYGYFGIEPIYSFDAINIELVASADIMCRGLTNTLTVNGTATNYTWSANAGSGTSGLQSIVVTPTVTGAVINYTVAGKDPASGCITNMAAFQVSLSACTGIMSEEKAANIKMYPNPTVNGKTTISGLDMNSSITVLNLLGQAILTESTKNGIIEIDLSKYPAGNYFIKVADENKHVTVVKLINQ